MTPFQRKSEQLITDQRNREPSYGLGLLVSSRDVILDSVQNPWFLSTRQMGAYYSDVTALIPDSQMNGYSVVGPDYDRPESRKTWTHIGMLIPGVQGSSGGKTVGVSPTSWGSSKSTHNYVHMLMGRKETPTGVVIEQRTTQTQLDTNTQITQQDFAKNGLLPGAQSGEDVEIPPVRPVEWSPDPGYRPPQLPPLMNQLVQTLTVFNGVTTVTTTVSKPPTYIPFNPATTDVTDKGELKPTKAKASGSLGSRISTGTTYVPTSKLKSKLGGRGGLR